MFTFFTVTSSTVFAESTALRTYILDWSYSIRKYVITVQPLAVAELVFTNLLLFFFFFWCFFFFF